MKSKFILFLVVFFVLRIFFAFAVWHPDVRNHVDWGERFFDYGAQGFYSPDANIWDYTWPNQPPGTVLMFAGVYQLFVFLFSVLTWVNQNIPPFPSQVMYFFELNLYPALAKLPAILADFGIAYLIYKITKNKLSFLIFLVNPVIWYNSSVWGQYDSVINFFALLSFYLLFRKKVILSFIALALSIYIKISLAIFVPVFLIVLFRDKVPLKKAVVGGFTTAVIFSLVTLLFSYPQNPVGWLYTLYTERVLGQQLHVITANAFNIWALFTGIHEQPDSLMWGPLSYQYWGYALFIPVYLFTLWKIWKSKGEMSVYAGLAVIAFASFVLLTNMHERYLYPLFPYFTVITLLNQRLIWLYVSVFSISLLNMYNYWFTPYIPPVVDLLEYGNRIVPRILGGVMTALFTIFFVKYYKNSLVKISSKE